MDRRRGSAAHPPGRADTRAAPADGPSTKTYVRGTAAEETTAVYATSCGYRTATGTGMF